MNFLQKLICVIFLVLALPVFQTLGFQMTDEQISQMARDNLLIMYEDNDIDEDIISQFVQEIKQNSDVFNSMAELETDSEILPYLERYDILKLQFTGRSINPSIKIVFAHHPLSNGDYDKSIDSFGVCDYFTRSIFLDRGLWDHYRENERLREAIVFHELGHCDLDRFDESAGPISFMTVFDIQCLFSGIVTESCDKFKNDRELSDSNFDQTLEAMNRELFSKENVKQYRCPNGELIEDNPYCVPTQQRILELFKEYGIPRLRRLIGLSGESL